MNPCCRVKRFPNQKNMQSLNKNLPNRKDSQHTNRNTIISWLETDILDYALSYWELYQSPGFPSFRAELMPDQQCTFLFLHWGVQISLSCGLVILLPLMFCQNLCTVRHSLCSLMKECFKYPMLAWIQSGHHFAHVSKRKTLTPLVCLVCTMIKNLICLSLQSSVLHRCTFTIASLLWFNCLHICNLKNAILPAKTLSHSDSRGEKASSRLRRCSCNWINIYKLQ